MSEGWAAIPNWIVRDPQITPQAKLLYVYLQSRTNRKQVCWPTLDKCAEETGMSKRSVQKALSELRDLGVVAWEKRTTAKGWHNVYSLSQFEGGCGTTDHRGVAPRATKEDTVEEDPLLPPNPPPGGASERHHPRQLTEAQEADCAAFYDLYPNKKKPGYVRQVWLRKIVRGGIDPSCVMAGLRAQLEQLTEDCKRDPVTNRIYCPHPSTWLNGEQWNDEITPRRKPERPEGTLVYPTSYREHMTKIMAELQK